MPLLQAYTRVIPERFTDGQRYINLLSLLYFLHTEVAHHM